MLPHEVDELGALLEEALEQPARSRAGFLAATCKGRPRLREELTSLLAAHDAASGYFERLTGEIVVPALQVFGRETDDELRSGQVIAQYELLEQLGSGGMGVVFKAFDRKLQRFVALKFLPAHLSTDATAKARLVAEAQATSALDHPNIGVVYDISETSGGRLFIVMRCYDGETLQRRKGQRVSPREAFDVVLQIGTALRATHQKGIIHRDVKPSNILVSTDGRITLLDFGIAKLADSTMARDNLAPGTIAYMSPEQTRGTGVDHRTDFWSLGVVLYEMLTGVRPFRAPSDAALVAVIRQQPWEPVDGLDPGLSGTANRVLARCLAKEPNERYEHAQALLDDVTAAVAEMPGKPSRTGGHRRRLATYGGAIAVLCLTAGGGLYLQRDGRTPASVARGTEAQPTRLAVLPMIFVGEDSDTAYLADGMTAEVTARLSRLGGLRVIARPSLVLFQDRGRDPFTIGRQLAATLVLDGTVHKRSGDVEVSLRLLDATRREHIWSEAFEADARDLRTVSRQIAARLAAVLRLQARADAREPGFAGPSEADAHLLYLKGRHLLAKWDAASAQRAKEYFEEALDLDPAYAQAWTGLADTYHVLGGLATLPASDAYPRTRAAAERALQLDPDLPEGHLSLATALSAYYWDFDRAAQHIRRAIELNPSDATAHNLYSEHLRYRGRFDEALAAAKRAEELDPLTPVHQIDEGVILYLARRYDDAITQFHRLLAMRPDHTYAYFPLALASAQSGRYEQALSALDRAGREGRLQVQQYTLRGYIHGRTGRSAQARRELDNLKRLSAEQHVSPFHFAVVHLGLGEYERALDLLERAYGERTWQLRLLAVEPIFDPVRSHGRFRALVEQIG